MPFDTVVIWLVISVLVQVIGVIALLRYLAKPKPPEPLHRPPERVRPSRCEGCGLYAGKHSWNYSIHPDTSRLDEGGTLSSALR
jgi:hypothetical protein